MVVKVEENPKKEEVFRVYKENPYFNSNKEPFGITLKGKTKEYVSAHENFKALIITGKVITTPLGKFKVLDAAPKQGMINATIEVMDEEEKGNAEIKVYNPSLNKKKGATIEIRKVSDFEYKYVERLKNIIENWLDTYLGSNDINGCKYYTCDICKWQTRFQPALKGHKKRMHTQTPTNDEVVCNKSEYKPTTRPSLNVHENNKHTNLSKKRQTVTYKCDWEKCESTFYYEANLKEHKISQHREKLGHVLIVEDTKSPSSSPPRKKQEMINEVVKENEIDPVEDEEMLDLDNMEIRVEKELSLNFLLQKRSCELEKKTNQLENIVTSLLNEKNKAEKEKAVAIAKIDIPDHLSGVNEAHLKKLNGYRMRYKALGNGACLENSTAVHVFEDEKQGKKVKSMINNHMADNWKTFL